MASARRTSRWLIATLCAGAGVLGLAAGLGAAPAVRQTSPSPTSPPPSEPTTSLPERETTETTAGEGIAVASVTDGDTVRLTDGRAVRLAQVDAPEPNECFGSQSTAALRELVDGRTVTLRRPPTGPERDNYGRTLADIVLDGRSVNETLVRDGAAEWYEDFADEDVDLAGRLQAAEQEAHAEGRGLWSACKASTPAAPPTTSPAPRALVDTPRGGNCHPAYPDDCIPPAPPDLNCGQLGRKVRVDQAIGDPHHLDADRDGWGCESYG